MFRYLDRLPSQDLGRSLHVWRYGHSGQPLLVFPSAAGMAHEWEAHGVVETLAPLIEAGKLKLYCTETNVAEAWTRKESDPAWRMQRHQAFERWVVDELAPRIRRDCGSEGVRLATTGCSLGAWYAVNFTLKHPDLFHWALGLSGRYDIRWLTDGADSPDVYFNNPMAYVANLQGPALEHVRRNTHFVLVCGQGQWEDGNIEDTNQLADLFEGKSISHERDLWGRDVSHEWPWWRRQALYHLHRAFGG